MSRPDACPTLAEAVAVAAHELRFPSLFHAGRGFAFPCDASGRVDLEAMAEPARRSYLRAWGEVGRELGVPIVAFARR